MLNIPRRRRYPNRPLTPRIRIRWERVDATDPRVRGYTRNTRNSTVYIVGHYLRGGQG